MKILLLGKNGQVGWELQRSLQTLGEVIALDRTTNPVNNLSGDITNFDAIKNTFERVSPDIVVNATAYTAVDKAESDQEMAYLVNASAVENLAKLTVEYDALLIHYSTDYVFNGEGQSSWKEDDLIEPVNYYGFTKRAGEVALEKTGSKFINFRTCWVYASHGHNFIKSMLKLAMSKNELSIIDDQIGAPTGAALIADITAQAIYFYFLQTKENQKAILGHYHLSASGETSWYAYAKYIFEIAREKGVDLAVAKVNPIKTVEYPTPAKRPLNSRLNTVKLETTFSITLPHWKKGVEHVLGEIV